MAQFCVCRLLGGNPVGELFVLSSLFLPELVYVLHKHSLNYVGVLILCSLLNKPWSCRTPHLQTPYFCMCSVVLVLLVLDFY